MNAVVTAALPVFALILTGWLAARLQLLGPGATDALNRYVVYLSLPALLFRAMTQVDLAHMAHWGLSARSQAASRSRSWSRSCRDAAAGAR